ncbi:MAG: acylphosphatase [Candidatus Methanomethylicia archaeon]
MDMKKKLIIKGEKVQDVGYRLFLLDVAEELGLKGFQARNVKDYVEFMIEGDEDQVFKFINFVKENFPPFAKVNSIICEDYTGEVLSIDRFYHRFSIDQLVKIVDIGLNMLKKQDEMLIKQDKMLEKQDLMLEKQDRMLEKQDKMLIKQNEMLIKQDDMLKGQTSISSKLDDVVKEVKGLREDLKSFVEERFSKIEREIALIKAKIGLI